MTLLLWGVAIGVWSWAIYLLWRVPTRTPAPPVEYVSQQWLAQFRRGRED